jgi:hypothetical protein
MLERVMGSVITKPVHHPVVLGSGNYGDTLLITSTGAIRPSTAGATALTAPGTLPVAFIMNAGTIRGGSGGPTAAGGVGIDFASAAGTITNGGLIAGGHGYYTPTGLQGGGGGAGLLASGAPSVENSGTIMGGGGAPAYQSHGGPGGVGVSLSAGTLANTGRIVGGHGGNVTYGDGDGGGGGSGVSLGTGATLQNMATIQGGAGGVGYFYGGAGGTAVVLAANEGASSNAGMIAGGNGGRELSELTDYTGGDGGVGVTLGSGDTFINDGTILGGRGGYGHSAGSGGTGVIVTRGTLITSGFIKGGATGGYFGQGGAGVSLNGGTLVDSGTITAGAGGGGGQPGDAVLFGSGGGQAILEAGAKIEGRFGGWGSGDTIDVRTVQATSFLFQGGTLSLLNAHDHVAYKLDFDGTYTSADFALKPDGAGGTDVIFGSAAGLPDFLPSLTLGGSGHAVPSGVSAYKLGALHMHEPDAVTLLFDHAHYSAGQL